MVGPVFPRRYSQVSKSRHGAPGLVARLRCLGAGLVSRGFFDLT